MTNITRHTRTELKQLPLMLCKLLGGIAAVLGVAMAVWLTTHGSEADANDAWLPLLVAGAGVAAFLLSDRWMTRRLSLSSGELHPAGQYHSGILSWGLLLFFAIVFLGCIYFLAM